MNKTEVERQAEALFKEKTWKTFLALGVILLVLAAIINSYGFLVYIIVGLLKFIFMIAGAIALGYAGYLYLTKPK